MPLKTFANEQDWLGVQVHKFIRLEEPTPNSQAKIIATFVERNVSKPGKAPRAGIAIAEHRPFANAKGESGGRVVLLTTTVNMDWTNWPGSPSFGAMTHELLHFVGADRKPRDEPKKDDNP